MTRDTFDRFQEPDRGRFGDNEAAPSRSSQCVNGSSDLIDVTVFMHAESKKGMPEAGAILVSEFGDDDRAKWIPKSQCSFTSTGKRARGTKGLGCDIVTVTLPSWMAKEKGLI